MDEVDLRSDTKSRPSAEMREAMASAEVGDEQDHEDPTTCALEARVAELLGKPAGVFLPSGTMANAVAFRVHVRAGGDEVYLERSTHPLQAEAGGPAALSGAMVWPIDGREGMFGPEDLEAVLSRRNPANRHAPRARLLSIEQTTNMGGGRVWPLELLDGVLDVARAHGLRAHLDGARLMNATVASGVSAARFCAGFDTAWIDFSKGLGAPVGAVLVGSSEDIAEAWRFKQMFGGAMRQSGILAAAGLYALDHHVERLAEDHEHAKLLAEGLSKIDGVEIDPSAIETNIVIFKVPRAREFCAALASDKILMGPLGPDRVRAVTHLDVKKEGVERAVEVAAAATW